ncbi:unnamed protein product, partial [Ixodes hexagonus]
TTTAVATGLLREGLWRAVNPDPLGTEDTLPVNNTLGVPVLNEGLSDLCLGQLFSRDGCHDLGDLCWRTMTSEGQWGYALTHQVLFLTIGMALNCSVKMDSLAQRDGQSGPWALLNSFCRAVVQEAERTAAMQFPAHLRDLFLEQG